MEQLEAKYNAIENGEVQTALKIISKKENKIIAFFKAIKKLVLGREFEEEGKY